jgi:hypothetical protein
LAAPALGVVAKNFRVGQAKSVNALLHITDEEAVADEFAVRFFSLSSPKEERGGVRRPIVCEFSSPLPGPLPAWAGRGR